MSDNKRLCLQAFDLGEVTLVQSSEIRTLQLDIFDVPAALKRRIFGNGEIYPHTAEATFQAYWRKLIADCEAYPTKRLDAASFAMHKRGFDEWCRRDHDTADTKSATDRVHMEIRMDKVHRPHASLAERLSKYEEPERSLHTASYSNMLYNMTRSWLFAATDSGVYCMVPPESQVGARLVVLQGGKVPMVLRPETSDVTTSQTPQYSIVGPAYVHGFMDGEALKLEEVEIALV